MHFSHLATKGLKAAHNSSCDRGVVYIPYQLARKRTVLIDDLRGNPDSPATPWAAHGHAISVSSSFRFLAFRDNPPLAIVIRERNSSSALEPASRIEHRMETRPHYGGITNLSGSKSMRDRI